MQWHFSMGPSFYRDGYVFIVCTSIPLETKSPNIRDLDTLYDSCLSFELPGLTSETSALTSHTSVLHAHYLFSVNLGGRSLVVVE